MHDIPIRRDWTSHMFNFPNCAYISAGINLALKLDPIPSRAKQTQTLTHQICDDDTTSHYRTHDPTWAFVRCTNQIGNMSIYVRWVISTVRASNLVRAASFYSTTTVRSWTEMTTLGVQRESWNEKGGTPNTNGQFESHSASYKFKSQHLARWNCSQGMYTRKLICQVPCIISYRRWRKPYTNTVLFAIVLYFTVVRIYVSDEEGKWHQVLSTNLSPMYLISSK